MRVIIIGGGVAGISAAVKMRRLDEKAEILVLEKSDEFAVSSCALPYYMSEEISESSGLMGSTVENMKDRFNIEVRLHNEVKAINRKENTLTIEGRDDEFYDKLIIATGASQHIPDINGILSEDIFMIRGIESVERIKEYIKQNNVKNVLIAGGGFIGVEMAESFYKLGMKVSIVEASSHVLPALDLDMASLIHNIMREKGMKIHLNQLISAFGSKEAKLNGGEKVPYDMALIATGVRPDVRLAVRAGLEIGESGGIKVNEQMQTSDEDIYAAGDTVEIINCVTGEPMLLPHAGLSIKEARTAAENISGKKIKFCPVVGTAITPTFDFTVAASGCNEKVLKQNKIDYDKIHVWSPSHAEFFPDSNQMLFKLLFGKDGKVLGVQGVGQHGVDKRIDVITEIIKKSGNLRDLCEAEIIYAPAYSAANDMVNYLGSNAQNVLEGQVKPIFADEIDWGTHQEDSMIVDIRPPEQFGQGHIPGAVNIPLTAVRDNLDLFPHDKKIILYCNRGYGAYNVNCILVNLGYENVYFLSGGLRLYEQLEKSLEQA